MSAVWTLVNEDEARASWNTHLVHFDDCTPAQTFEWGQFQKGLGWQPIHYVVSSGESDVKAMCLGLLRRLPGRIGFVWSVGGPVGDISAWDELPQTILATQGLRRLYFRLQCERKRRPSDVLFLRWNKWKPSSFMMVSNVTMVLDLSVELATLFSKFAAKWRKSFRLTQKEELVIERTGNPDIGEIHKLYAEMEGLKNIAEIFPRDKLRLLFEKAGSKLIFLICRDRKGKPIAFRGAFVIGDRGHDFLAATNSEGRRLQASYPLLWDLLRHCREAGINRYDLGGIDMWENPGVYLFKKHTGASEMEMLGEWDWASSSFLRWLGNFIVCNKQLLRSVRPHLSSRLLGLLKRLRHALVRKEYRNIPNGVDTSRFRPDPAAAPGD